MWYDIALIIRRSVHFFTRPETYGVKVMVKCSGKILLVRHSYGRKDVWHLPGGGYNPSQENPEHAAVREMDEELAFSINPSLLKHIYTHHTQAEYKKDEVKVFTCEIFEFPNFIFSKEIVEAKWVAAEDVINYKTYSITKNSLTHI